MHHQTYFVEGMEICEWLLFNSTWSIE